MSAAGEGWGDVIGMTANEAILDRHIFDVEPFRIWTVGHVIEFERTHLITVSRDEADEYGIPANPPKIP